MIGYMKNEAAVELGRLGGLARTEAKARAARENGRRGGNRVALPDPLDLVGLKPRKALTEDQRLRREIEAENERRVRGRVGAYV